MTAQSTVCPVCGEEAPFGRRTCEACGANLTAVSGTEAGDAPAEALPEPTGLLVSEDEPLAASEAFSAAETPAPETPAEAFPVADPPPAEAPPIATAVAAHVAVAPPIVAEPLAAAPPVAAEASPAQPPVVAEPPAPAPPVVAPPVPQPAAPLGIPTAPGTSQFMPPVLKEWTAVPPVAQAAVAVELAAAEAEPDPAMVAGAWLPPSAINRVGTAAASGPRVAAAIPAGRPWLPSAGGAPPTATPAAPSAAPPALPPAASTGADGSPTLPPSLAEMLSRSSTGTARWPDDAVTPAPIPAMTVTASAAARLPERPSPESSPAARREGVTPGRAPLFADLPFDAPDSLAGWLVAAGGAVAAVAFFLPWSPFVLGASGFGSYFDEWGFATAAYWPIFLLVAITAALSILENRVAPWLRHGVLGLVTGGLLLGIVWPYLVGGFGARIGVLAEAVASALLIVGGLVAVAPPRSDREAR